MPLSRPVLIYLKLSALLPCFNILLHSCALHSEWNGNNEMLVFLAKEPELSFNYLSASVFPYDCD
jgi:hypothetical protein